ncbi:hypothetical protein PCL_04843 [Purpureocillium lilacinum]|uniref:Cytochrome c oxidase polypeptide V n=1 Tax=Purpureocillium lilacinum TaxID=33203 RepID=A0A2U3DWR6_PURLI|nr:hypothetical protein Purlil1_11352 [Purpureocillium lilacinum]PWI66705.1 hypothetical protein PCL_04843 [Purpureocillium lilacinum]
MLRTQATSVLRKGALVRSVPAVASRAASTAHAISNPTLANIEKRWEGMPLQEQADLWMALRDRMKGSWADLTVQEKKAAEGPARGHDDHNAASASAHRQFLNPGLHHHATCRSLASAVNFRPSIAAAAAQLKPLAARAGPVVQTYWIAFGPHGPRAVDPPGTNARIAWGVALGLGVSFAVFATIRAFAKPVPATMTKEYQEASNELLKQQKADPITGISSEGYSGKGQVQSPPKGN